MHFFCKIHSHSHLKLQTVKNVCETHNQKTLHVSVIIILPSSGVVLCASAITTFSACLLRLSDMWLYVVYVYVCPVYLPMCCLVVNCECECILQKSA